jgi:hypothetical protein
MVKLPQTLLQSIEDEELRRELLERELAKAEKVADGLYRPRTAKVKKLRDFADIAAETLSHFHRRRRNHGK